MHAVVRHYTGASPLVEAMESRGGEVEQLLKGVDGFVSYQALRSEGGGLTTITTCADRAGTEESTRRAGEWVRANLSGMTIPTPVITEGEVFLGFAAGAATPALGAAVDMAPTRA